MARLRRKTRVAVKPTIFFAVLLLIAGTLVTIWEYARIHGDAGTGYRTAAFDIAPGESATLDLPAAGGREWMVLHLATDGPVSIRTDGVDMTGGPAAILFNVDPGNRFCLSGEGNEVTCDIPARKNNRDAAISFFTDPSGPPVHVDIDITLRKYKRATAASGEQFRNALLTVLLLIPLVWITHRSIAVSQWLITATAVGLLLYIEPLFALFTLAFVSCLYRVAVLFGSRPDNGRRILYWSLAACGCFLVAFKYGGFAVMALLPDIGGLALALPLGLSYFVIRIIDVLLRCYRGDLTVSDYRSYLCYLLFPATIPAGPIMSYDGFRDGRLEKIGADDIAYGVGRIIIGLAKKLLIADLLLTRLIFHPDYGVFDAVVMDPSTATGGAVLAYLLLNFLFVYVDFSAYSDIAIGLGRLLGYRINENFNFPLLVTSLRQYWQRWHMTLSNWCMRNVFMPVSLMTRSQLAATLSVFLIIGLWHDASMNWFFWGLHHGIGVAVLMWISRWRLPAVPAMLKPVKAIAGGIATILYVAAGHSFVSLNNFEISFSLYLAFWKSLLFIQ